MQRMVVRHGQHCGGNHWTQCKLYGLDYTFKRRRLSQGWMEECGGFKCTKSTGFAMETRRPMQNKHARPPNEALMSCSSLVTPPDQGNGEELGFCQFLYWGGFSFSF
ncbi:hypothetical protein OPV22_024553 [Ensete ventricosum]|uniref:Uncharacterized protein n=1 Tax=Ensete ventricosum TaxID=4639 RepID=A0AAV8QF95_ENSVE|nr:hypothetical protein OPV22_024553 [Ensete ventricosum]